MTAAIVGGDGAFAQMLSPVDGSTFRSEELFDLACIAAQRRSHLSDPSDVRVFADENIVSPAQIDSWLPSRDRHGDFDDYAAELLRRGESFALTINSLQQFSWDFWRRLRPVAEGHHASRQGEPAGGTDCHLIASVYGTAPTLVHKDTADVVTYVVSGWKRYYLWPFEVFADIGGDLARQQPVDLPAYIRCEDYLDDAIVLEGGPGSVFTWSSDMWHCGTSNGELAVSLHMAHYVWEDRLEQLIRRIRRHASEKLGALRFAANGAKRVGASDDEIRSALVEQVRGPGINDELELRRLRRSTASHFEVVPGIDSGVAFHDEDRLSVPDCSVAEAALVGDQLHVGANGHVFRVAGAPWVRQLLPLLTAGSARTVSGWLELARAVGSPADDESRAVLCELARRGAFEQSAR